MPTLRESCEFALVRYGGTLMTPEERRIALPLARAADNGDAAARRALRVMVDDVLRRTRLRNTAAARAAADALRVKA